MSDEQEDIGHSMTINDELRLCRMTGDDEDDVAGDNICQIQIKVV